MKKRELKLELTGTPAEQLEVIQHLLLVATNGLDNLVGRLNHMQLLYVLDSLETNVQIIRRRLGGKPL